jgi:hypothetical protein
MTAQQIDGTVMSANFSDYQRLIFQAPWEVLMSNPKFPSEEQGGYDPMQRSPQPLSPGRMTVNPDNKPGIDELPDDEAAIDAQRVREKTDNTMRDKQKDLR